MLRSNWKLQLAVLGFAGALTAGSVQIRADEAPAKPAAAASASADVNTLTEKEKADGWRLLFDGKSTDQWRNYRKQTVSDKWKIEDGALVLTGGGGGDLITKEQFENYELVLDYKISKGGNSGLIFNVQENEKKPPYDSGPEVQIQDNVDGHDPQKAGWLYQLYQPPIDPKTNKPIDATKPAGEWNQLRFSLHGRKGEIQMNGVKYAEFEIGSDDWNARLAKSKFAKWEAFAKAPKGHICLQDHGNVVAFRNIKIRSLESK